jgi:YD repeat-containing protein
LARISDTVSGDILFGYDDLNRLTEVVTAQGTVRYTYDAIGRRTTRTISGGDTTEYSYDNANRLKTVTLRGKTVTYNYDAAGRVIEKVLPNGVRVEYSYDLVSRITSVVHRNSEGAVVASAGYSYDAAGQRLEKSQADLIAEEEFNATYDASNRLSSVTISGETLTIAYDANGNLISKSGPQSGLTTYVWNARDQLVGLSGSWGSASFKYDAMGRRIEKTVNGVTTGFLYDGVQAIAELRGGAIDTVTIPAWMSMRCWVATERSAIGHFYWMPSTP